MNINKKRIARTRRHENYCFVFSENIEEYIDDTLSVELQRTLNYHIRKCLKCQEQIESRKEIIKVIKNEIAIWAPGIKKVEEKLFDKLYLHGNEKT